VLIEDRASGTQLIQELVERGLHAVTRYQPQADEIIRMHAQTAMIENGFVHLPKEAGWLAEYLHELTVPPNGKHDDQVPPDTSFRGRPRRCSTGSSEATAPAPMPGSTNITKCSPKNFARGGSRRDGGFASAPLPALGRFSCFQGSTEMWQPTARSRCQKRCRAAAASRVGEGGHARSVQITGAA